MVKTCSKCGESKGLGEYHQAPGRSKAYLRGVCKTCRRLAARKYHQDRRLKENPLLDNVVYDYKFARFTGRSHRSALLWLAHGYRELDLETLQTWKLSQFANDPWEVDES